GADIAEFSSYTVEEARKLSARGQAIFFQIENCTKPVVAAVNGFALGGGCELAMSCHFRLCSDNAKFGQPEVNLGLIPGYGGTQRLTQLVGKGKSMELHMTGQMMDATEALRLGLVNYVTASEHLLPKVREILATINTKAPIAISKVIETINTATNGGGVNGFTKEVNAFAECFGTEDMKEGTSAFMEKRKPVFKGK
ncbi:MAG: enoyl-CoA hydratase, partial [Chitinophagaceae bacterium]